jgi:hypothetical protein
MFNTLLENKDFNHKSNSRRWNKSNGNTLFTNNLTKEVNLVPNETETITVDNQSSLSKFLVRYPYIECPSISVLNEKFSLFIQILVEAKKLDKQAIRSKDNYKQSDCPPEIEIALRVYNFDVKDSIVRTVKIDKNNDIEERFVLTPRRSGDQEIRVDFYQSKERIGALKHDIHILS